MTFRQVIAIIWQRRLIGLLTAAVVVLIAALYAVLAPVSYQATAEIRYSPAATSALSGSASYGSIVLDLDPDYVASQEIATVVATKLGDDAAAVQASVATTMVEKVRANRLQITAVGDSPQQAQDRANTVAQVYIDHLADQVSAGIAGLQAQLQTQQQAQTDALNALNKDVNDRLAQQNFNTASAQVAQFQTQITTIQSAGAPAAMMQQAATGVRTGVSVTTIALIGAFTGLLLGAGVSLIREQFDDRMRTTDHVEDAINGHVLGDVALVSRKEKKASRLPVTSRIPTPFNESVRGLRTSLQVVFPDRHVAIAITSAEPGEGKTFLTSNLAVAMARSGRTVILVEADLRRPRVNLYFDMPETAPGFAQAIESDADEAAIASWLIDTPFDGLQILPAGQSRHEPADLLAGDGLHRVLARLRTMADVVLLDTPPGLALADASIIGRESDGVVVVAALNRSRRTALRNTLQVLSSTRSTVVGTVVNRSRRASVRTYAHYYHAAPDSLVAGLPTGQEDQPVIVADEQLTAAPGAAAEPSADTAEQTARGWSDDTRDADGAVAEAGTVGTGADATGTDSAVGDDGAVAGSAQGEAVDDEPAEDGTAQRDFDQQVETGQDGTLPDETVRDESVHDSGRDEARQDDHEVTRHDVPRRSGRR